MVSVTDSWYPARTRLQHRQAGQDKSMATTEQQVLTAGEALVRSAAAAGQARYVHERHLKHPGETTPDGKMLDTFKIAQARRAAEAQASSDLEAYISTYSAYQMDNS
jgi:L-2-hydroxyglutarate oxidase LhgO